MSRMRYGRSRPAPRRAALAACALAVLALAPAAPGAAAPRHPSRGLRVAVLSCVTGNVRVATRLGCPTTPGVGGPFESSGLQRVTALAASAGGTSLYAVSHDNSSLTQLSLGPSRALSFAACVTGNSSIHTCTDLPGAAANAVGAPIASPTAAAASPDGRSLYVTSGEYHDAVIARFARDPTSGALAYQGCLTGDLAAGPSSPAACALLPSATRDGYGSGIYGASGIAISPDGHRVYVTAAGDGSVVAFDRDSASGALSLAACVSSNRRAGGCVRTPGGEPILEGIRSPFLSPDGRYLYGVAYAADSVSAFRLGGAAGLRFAGCVTSRDDRRPCRRGRRPAGAVAAISGPSGLTGTADGRFLYVSSIFGDLVVLKRNRATGALTPASCISSGRTNRRRCARVPRRPKKANLTQKATLLTGLHTPLLARGDGVLIAPVGSLDGLVEFNRNRRTGALSFGGCATGNLTLSTARRGPCRALAKATGNGTGSGFHQTAALIRGPGKLLYAAAWGDSTVSLLRP